MWNTALVFSNKNHGLQKKTFYRKNSFFALYYAEAATGGEVFF